MRTFLALVLFGLLASSATCEEPWKDLFNGKDLSGWKQVGKAKWAVEEAAIVGRQGENATGGELLSEEEFENFELIVTFKAKWPANSGIWFRFKPGVLGYQVDILEFAKYNCTVGSIYAKGGFITRFADESIVKKDDWNTIYVKADGTHIEVKVNEVETAAVDNDRYEGGMIGIQVHAGKQFEGMEIIIKEIKIREL